MEYKKNIARVLIVVSILSIWLCGCIQKDPKYVKSAHYFSNEWPINFWNTEMDYMETELEQIKRDGFDSIILVIPWREFQPTMNPITYNEYAFEKLDEVMKCAQKERLNVFVRMGYTWDFYQDANDYAGERFKQLLYDETTKQAWRDYITIVYQKLSEYDNFKEGFLTWEDFWMLATMAGSDEQNEADIALATKIGYQDFIKKTYSLEEYNEKYKEKFESYETICLPPAGKLAKYAYYEFYDNFMNELLKETQTYFPNISMEVRMDYDPIYDNGEVVGFYKHESTFSCQDSTITSTMYGIPMGCENKGERLSYKEAINKTDHILGNLKSKNDGKDIYVEQFIFADNTPAFKHNAQVKEEELNDYLENVALVLRKNTWGYGIWTYRNYRGNMIYNPQFALELQGWSVEGSAEVKEYEKSNALLLSANAALKQNIPAIRNHFASEEYTFSFDVKSEEKAELVISMGIDVQTLVVDGKGTYQVTFGNNETFDISILAKQDVAIDNLCLYSQVQEGFLYDYQNNELQCAEGIRKLNYQLEHLELEEDKK